MVMLAIRFLPLSPCAPIANNYCNNQRIWLKFLHSIPTVWAIDMKKNSDQIFTTAGVMMIRTNFCDFRTRRRKK